ncbi:MAG TPA: 2-oxo-4-hydroxy-4-carboxy-5-ureidoimidazoline decarboxylase [Gemmatimonadales bacterium]|nr:2-oxo-4-hydroxy-4-carboxy-5-ureidoimidazoline decarboxylase [Gemmatimonadales bacterium]
MLSLDALNSLPESEASDRLHECAGSSRWVRRMLRARPFPDVDTLLKAADRAWEGSKRADWLEAFAGHPRIGERAASAWSRQEQSAARDAARRVSTRIAELNREYEERFGHIYIVCATGRTGEELLGDLLSRMGNDAEHELRVAAREQQKITRLRLEELLRVEEQ